MLVVENAAVYLDVRQQHGRRLCPSLSITGGIDVLINEHPQLRIVEIL